MPIENGSRIWPKILVCKACNQPVERGIKQDFEVKIGTRNYACPNCQDWIPSSRTQWVERANLEQETKSNHSQSALREIRA